MKGEDPVKIRLRKLEQEKAAGRARVKYWERIEAVERGEIKLNKAFQRINVTCTIPAPYDHVHVRALVGGKTVLDELEPIEGFPSEFLVAKLALI